MKNTIKMCENCKKINIEKISKIVKEIDNNIAIEIGCQNFCGICSVKAFVILNNIPLIENTEEELIKKITDKLKIGANSYE